MKTTIFACMFTFITIFSTSLVTYAIPPLDEGEPLRFNNVRELIHMIETGDISDIRQEWYMETLSRWREYGQLFVVKFENDDVVLTRIESALQDGNMFIVFTFTAPEGIITAQVSMLNPKYKEVYRAYGVGAYFDAIFKSEALSVNNIRLSMHNVHITAENVDVYESVEVPYVFVDNLENIGITRIAHKSFVIGDFEISIFYRRPELTQYMQYFMLHQIPITNRSEVLESNMSLLSPGATLRFTTGAPLFTIDLAPFHGIAQPFIDTDHNRTMIPLRTITDAFGLPAEWDSTTRTARVQIGNNWHYIPYGTPLPDGLGTPIIRNDRIFLPLRYIADLLDAEARWDSNSRSAYIYMP